MRSILSVINLGRGRLARRGRRPAVPAFYWYGLRGTESMYRKLVFVLTMLAVAVGSLSQAQAALASPRPAGVASAAHARQPASIATHSATGAVRPATAGHQMAPRARLRTEQKQGSLPLGPATSERQHPALPRSPAPESSHHLYRRPGRELYRHVDRVAHVRIVRNGHTADGSHVHGQRGRHGDNHGNTGCGLPAEHTRSRSPRRTVSVLTPPRPSP